MVRKPDKYRITFSSWKSCQCDLEQNRTKKSQKSQKILGYELCSQKLYILKEKYVTFIINNFTVNILRTCEKKTDSVFKKRTKINVHFRKTSMDFLKKAH